MTRPTPFLFLGRILGIGGALAIAFATLTPSSELLSQESFCLVCGELGGVDVVLNVLLYLHNDYLDVERSP